MASQNDYKVDKNRPLGQAKYEGVTSATRHRMLAVKRRDTGPEMRVRRTLHAMGYRFRLHRKNLPGTPDIVLPRHGKIILVNGCFWHGHQHCRRAKLPINNADTWRAKIEHNQRRDEKNIRELRKLGWGVLTVWECEISDTAVLKARLSKFLQSN